jgi:hypothetical protein
MTNDGMPNDEGNPNDECRMTKQAGYSAFGVRHSFVIGHSVIRHSSTTVPRA